MKKRVSSGFTLIELLVVMSIIAILAAMLMPAVNAVRETARKIECTNNMRNVAIALYNHDSTKGSLPARFHPIYVENPNDPDKLVKENRSWVYHIWPFIERRDLWEFYGPKGLGWKEWGPSRQHCPLVLVGCVAVN